MSAKNLTFVAALKDYFGIEAGDMVREYKALSDNDKADLRAMLEDEGYTIESPSS